MKMSTRARYALRLMIDLADQDQSEGPTRLQDIAKRQNISRRYLEQLAINLKNANLLLVTCGRGGDIDFGSAPTRFGCWTSCRRPLAR